MNNHFIVDKLPTQLEIQITEKCGLNCDYCFVNKSCEQDLSTEKIKKALNHFFSLDIDKSTITFTTGEPYANSGVFFDTLKELLSKRNKIDRIVSTTNGIFITNDIINKINDTDEIFTQNLSIDGKAASTDNHRKFINGDKSVFEKVWPRFKSITRNNRRIIYTITPDNASKLVENITFFLDEGFYNIDIFPQMLVVWEKDSLEMLYMQLKQIPNLLNIYPNSNLRLLNRLWGRSHLNKLLLASDGNFYVFEFVLSLPYPKRKFFNVGNYLDGIDLHKRVFIFSQWIELFYSEKKFPCEKCSYHKICFPLPLFLYQQFTNKLSENYFKSFCLLAKMMIDAATSINNINKNKIDIVKLDILEKN